MDNIAELLEMKSSKLVDALTQPTIKVHDKLIRKNQNLAKVTQNLLCLKISERFRLLAQHQLWPKFCTRDYSDGL